MYVRISECKVLEEVLGDNCFVCMCVVLCIPLTFWVVVVVFQVYFLHICSVVAVSSKVYSVGDTITMNLMKRPKVSECTQCTCAVCVHVRACVGLGGSEEEGETGGVSEEEGETGGVSEEEGETGGMGEEGGERLLDHTRSFLHASPMSLYT